MKAKLPENVSRWEILGVSAAPIVLAIFELELPEALGLTHDQTISILAALMTVAAIMRAGLDARAGRGEAG